MRQLSGANGEDVYSEPYQRVDKGERKKRSDWKITDDSIYKRAHGKLNVGKAMTGAS